MIKTIVFDAFDTLFRVESGASARYVINRIAESGRGVDEAEFHRVWKEYYNQNTVNCNVFKTEREIFTSRIRMLYDRYGICGDADADANLLMEKSKNRCVFDDVVPTLEFLKGKCDIYIGSNTDNDVLFAVMQKNGVKVDKVYTSENLRCYKPSKQFYKTIINENRLLCDEVLFVGDSLTDDVFGPQKAGIKACWLNRNGKAGTTITPDYEIESLAELMQIVYR